MRRSPADAARGRRRSRPTDLNVVLGVERERVLDQHAAARAERQALDVLVLRQLARRRVRRLCRGRRAIADGQAADLQRRRRRIPGSAQAIRVSALGDVVEAFARIVGRQQRRRVDLQWPADRGSRWRTRSG